MTLYRALVFLLVTLFSSSAFAQGGQKNDRAFLGIGIGGEALTSAFAFSGHATYEEPHTSYSLRVIYVGPGQYDNKRVLDIGLLFGPLLDIDIGTLSARVGLGYIANTLRSNEPHSFGVNFDGGPRDDFGIGVPMEFCLAIPVDPKGLELGLTAFTNYNSVQNIWGILLSMDLPL